MKRTTLKRAILSLKKRQWLCEGIDDEKASIIEECILDIENYFDVECEQIIQAYKDGLNAIKIGKNYKPRDYFENNYK